MSCDITGHVCRRCGTCCEKGGPSLHREDRFLVDDGLIPASCLFTLRKGERVRDNVKGRLVSLTAEVVKIKGRDGRWTCRFYDRTRRGCAIYDHRPLECRALDCRDTREIEAIYAADRLTRSDLLSRIDGLWELVVDHEARCGYDLLDRLVRQGASGGRLKEEATILEIMRFDAHVRQLTVEKGGMDPAILDFLFGRPLAETIGMFALRLTSSDAGCRLVSTAEPAES